MEKVKKANLIKSIPPFIASITSLLFFALSFTVPWLQFYIVVDEG